MPCNVPIILSLLLIKYEKVVPQFVQPLQLPLYYVKLGFLFSIQDEIDSQVGYAGSAGAVSFAVEKAREIGLLNSINLTYHWRFDNGSAAYSLGYAIDLMKKDDISALFGPVTPEAQRAVAALSEYKKFPHFVWGTPSPYDKENKYNSTMVMSGSALGSIVAVMNVCNQYDWEDVAFIHSATTSQRNYLPFCDTVADTIEDGVARFGNNVTLTYNRELQLQSMENYKRVLEQASARARVFILCIADERTKRDFMLAALEAGKTAADYVYIIMQSSGTVYGSPPYWKQDDGRDNEAKEAFKSALILDKPSNFQSAEYNERVMQLVKEYPWMCEECATSNASSLGFYLGDSVLAYLYAINRTIETYHNDFDLTNILKNATYVLRNIPDSYEDLEGDVTEIVYKKTRIVDYAIYGLDEYGMQQTWAYTTNKATAVFRPNYTNAATTIWATRGGHRPMNEPLCGYQGNKCPIETWILTVTITSGALVLVFILLFFLGVICCFQRRRRSRLNDLWRVDFHELDMPKNLSQTKSARSSTTTLSQTASLDTIDNNKFDNIKFFIYKHELVVGRKTPRAFLTPAVEAELREMRTLDHPQLNRFLGVAASGPDMYALFWYCERGTIEDVIREHKDRMDQRIIHNMISQIVEGLHFVQTSPLGAMGSLCSDTCLVNDRFEVKLQGYGFATVKENYPISAKNKKILYIAPEHLRRSVVTCHPTKSGDIYSLAILITQISTKRSVWSLEERGVDVETIFHNVAKRTEPLERPPLRGQGFEVDARLESLIIQCFDEDATHRPDINHVRERIRFLETGRKGNLMDYMFALMENTAIDLEQQVTYRTAELKEEQRKAEILLNRMMPSNIVEQLRRGETVVPEVYESATVYFSDIVGFTTLSSKSTPLQVISFLNNTYTVMDDAISRYDVYKVETIGDGLHCVSGIPLRNGNNHVREICDMALEMREAIKNVKMSHLPDDIVQIRLGIHSGACVTGIVGKTAPRYCVFGETVNLAAKMESLGKPGSIQISCITKQLIDDNFHDRYVLEYRDEIYVKNHEPINTYWLLSKQF